ncbi:MAG: extracellular solute-binding protein [Eubacteriales bacterium]|jgi:putative aldouronate transport system substrate-binding protein
MRRALFFPLAVVLLVSLCAACFIGDLPNGATAIPAAESPSDSDTSQDFSSPIVSDGSVTLRIWMPMAEEARHFITNFADGTNKTWIEVMKRTGINLEFIQPSYFEDAEKFNLMLASGDYPDIYKGSANAYPGGGDKAIEDGIFLRLNELLEKHAPNYLKWVNISEANQRESKTDTGNMVCMSQVYDRFQPPFAGYAVRQDWLDDLGLESPKTYDDWYQMLSAFRDKKTDGAAPMEITSTGLTNNNFFNGGYGVASNNCYMIQRDNIVSCSIIEDGFRKYLDMMAAWYARGLIDPDFAAGIGYSGQGYGPNDTRVRLNQSGAVAMMYTLAGTYLADAGIAEPEAVFTLTSLPVEKAGTIPKVTGIEKNNATMIGGYGGIVFASTRHPVEAVRFMDYFYSPEGMILANYGIEGETFRYDESGHPRNTDLITNNPDMQMIIAMQVYQIHTGFLVYMLDREEDTASEYALAYRKLWSPPGEWNLPGSLTYTSAEGSRRSELVANIEPYVQDFTCKVIMGIEPLNDKTWESFVDTIKTMGIDEIVSITQAAYNRYLSR